MDWSSLDGLKLISLPGADTFFIFSFFFFFFLGYHIRFYDFVKFFFFGIFGTPFFDMILYMSKLIR